MKYTFFDFAKEVLERSQHPLTYQEIWSEGERLSLDKKLKTSGKTPWQTLGARLFVEVRDNQNSLFLKIGKKPARFYLSSRENEINDNTLEKIEEEEIKQPKDISKYHERDLHPLLTYFVYANPSFGKGKDILTKTIYHEQSKKKGYSEWVYPDMVGFYIPLEIWELDIIEIGKLINNNIIKFYSFELKKTLNKGNYREAFFQAVSNSSWANEGYLVTTDIKQDDDFLSELERLTLSFGIGIIHLNIKDIDSSAILFPANPKINLDWETMNKLCSENKDFQKFIQDVKIDFDSRRIHKSEYDEIIDNPEKYINDKIIK